MANPIPGGFPPDLQIPSDPSVRSTIEQIARLCVTNPAFEEVLRQAASGDKHAVLLKGKEFVVDQGNEGHQYFKWCLEAHRKQQQGVMPPPSEQMHQSFDIPQPVMPGYVVAPPYNQCLDARYLHHHHLHPSPPPLVGVPPFHFTFPAPPSSSDFRLQQQFIVPPPPEIQSTQYDINALLMEMREPSPPTAVENGSADMAMLTATTASECMIAAD